MREAARAADVAGVHEQPARKQANDPLRFGVRVASKRLVHEDSVAHGVVQSASSALPVAKRSNKVAHIVWDAVCRLGARNGEGGRGEAEAEVGEQSRLLRR